MTPRSGISGEAGREKEGSTTTSDDLEKLRWAECLKAQGWGYYRAAFTHGRALWAHAQAAFEQAEALYREVGTDEARAGLIGVLAGRATVLRASGDPETIREAIALHRQEVTLVRQLGRDTALPEALINIALAVRDLVTVDPSAATSLSEGLEACREALERAGSRGAKDAQALAASALADLSLLMADLDSPDFRQVHLREALGFYGQAEKLWGERDPDGRALARLGLAEVYVALGQNLEGAKDLLDEIFTYYRDYGGGPVSGPVRYQMAQCREIQARLAEVEGRPEDAARLRQEGRDQLDGLGFQAH